MSFAKPGLLFVLLWVGICTPSQADVCAEGDVLYAVTITGRGMADRLAPNRQPFPYNTQADCTWQMQQMFSSCSNQANKDYLKKFAEQIRVCAELGGELEGGSAQVVFEPEQSQFKCKKIGKYWVVDPAFVSCRQFLNTRCVKPALCE